MIKIKYNGKYPNLCGGTLTVTIDGKEWTFPDYCLESGGSVYFDNNYSEIITDGPWDIAEQPKGFPEEKKEIVLKEINEKIPWGCCGWCV